MRKKWVFAPYDKDRVASLAEECGIPVFTALLLASAGLDNKQAVGDFLDAGAPDCNPLALRDMDRARDCVMQALESGERICIYGDYDADGVSAVAVLYSYLEAMGADVIYYIPSRLEEGYGLHASAVQKIANRGASLIVTVDTGINAFDAALAVKESGMKLVITDHHMPSGHLPEAIAVVDPHREDDTSGFNYLAGVGVAFLLIAALEGGCGEELLSEYAQLAALGTVADIMPLVGENRRLVTAGLESINAAPLPGIRALLDTAGLSDKKKNAGHVAFGLAPRINAAGRMDSAESALRLLLSETDETARYYAAELEKKNKLRHEAEEDIARQIHILLEKQPQIAAEPVIVVSGKNWHEGVIGIAASRVAEEYGKPAVVISENENGTAKGSCRGVPGFSILDAIADCSSLLTHYGGHTLAAGLGLSCENIAPFRRQINRYARQHIPGVPCLSISCKLNPAAVSFGLLDALEMLEPFGAGNPKPVFAFCSMELVSVKAIGAGGRHSRLVLRRGGTDMQAVRFGCAPEDIPFSPGDLVDIAAVIEKNEYNGRVLPSVQIREMRFSGTDDQELFASYDIFRKIDAGIPLSEAERQKALPDRKTITRVYQFVRSHGTVPGAEAVLKRLGEADSALCRVAVSLKALSDCGVLKRENGCFSAVDGAKKADLTHVPVLAELGYTE